MYDELTMVEATFLGPNGFEGKGYQMLLAQITSCTSNET